MRSVSVQQFGMAEGSIGVAEMCGQLHLECVLGMAEGRIISFKVVCDSKNNEMANYQ